MVHWKLNILHKPSIYFKCAIVTTLSRILKINYFTFC